MGKLLQATALPSCWFQQPETIPVTFPPALCPRRGAAGRFAHSGSGGSWCEGTRHRCCSPLQPPGEMMLSFSMCTVLDPNLDTSRRDPKISSEGGRWRSEAEAKFHNRLLWPTSQNLSNSWPRRFCQRAGLFSTPSIKSRHLGDASTRPCGFEMKALLQSNIILILFTQGFSLNVMYLVFSRWTC